MKGQAISDPHNCQIARFCKGQGAPFPCSTSVFKTAICQAGKQTQSHKMSARIGGSKLKFVCLSVAIDRSQTRLLEIFIAVELPVSAVALTKPLPIVFET